MSTNGLYVYKQNHKKSCRNRHEVLKCLGIMRTRESWMTELCRRRKDWPKAIKETFHYIAHKLKVRLVQLLMIDYSIIIRLTRVSQSRFRESVAAFSRNFAALLLDLKLL